MKTIRALVALRLARQIIEEAARAGGDNVEDRIADSVVADLGSWTHHLAQRLAIRHRYCPSCGSQNIGHQLLGSGPDEDPNSASCGNCGCTWGGLRRKERCR